MDKFFSMQTAVAVAEEGNFTAAAAKLGISASNVTKLIARLEEDLGLKLFHRTTRRVSPTEAGQKYCDQCVKIIADMHETEAGLKDANALAKGVIRLVVPNLFGRVTLIPALPQFYARYPGISLNIAFSDRPVDLAEGGYDIGIQVGEMPDTSVVRSLLISGPQITAASAEYLRQRGTPLRPEDLHDHNCLYGCFGPEWRFKLADGSTQSILVKGNFVSFNGDALREAAIYGLGIVHSTWWALKSDLDAGRLKQILTKHVVEGPGVSVVYSVNRHVPARVRALIDFLSEITAVKRGKKARLASS